jgi:hypothetical protein
MGIVVRGLLALAGVLAAAMVARDAANFGLVQGMMALLAAVAALIAVGLVSRR